MRIYFVGAHSTGKTTLARYVSQRYELPMITEVARGVLAEMETTFDVLRTDLKLVDEYQSRVFARQVEVEKAHGDSFVSDRAFDNLAYAAEHATVSAELMSSKKFADYIRWIRLGVVFFVRPHRSLVHDDGTREHVTWDGVVRIDGMIKLLLEQQRVRYLPIDTASMQERARIIDYAVDHHSPRR